MSHAHSMQLHFTSSELQHVASVLHALLKLLDILCLDPLHGVQKLRSCK
jgi:hypothetical protein